MIRISGCLICLMTYTANASIDESLKPATEQIVVLPDPLNLQQALAFASDQSHYDMMRMQSEISHSEYQLRQAQANMGFSAQLELEAAYVEPSSLAFDPSHNDSSLSLVLNKPLLNISVQENIQAAKLEYQALQDNMQYQTALRKLEIARQFFEVLLADLKFSWDNEAMAIAFVRFDALKDRYALLQISDVEFLESENNYLEVLHQRSLSEINQRHSRALLAESLNRPQQLPSNLQTPVLDFSHMELPDYPELLQTILMSSPDIQRAEKNMEAAQQRISAETKQFYPRLEAELEVAEYERQGASNDDWRAQLNLILPLYKTQQMKSASAQARANWLKQRSSLEKLKSQLRQQVLVLWQKVNLLKQRHQQLRTTQDLRELSLDKSRALYEMEVKTNLGDAMVAVSENKYRQAQNDFELMLALMQLRILSGEADILNTRW